MPYCSPKLCISNHELSLRLATVLSLAVAVAGQMEDPRVVRRLYSDQAGSSSFRRHYSDEKGCVNPNAVFAAPVVERCRANMGNNTAAEFCEDPYFGGLPSCCYDVQVSLQIPPPLSPA